MSESGHSQLGMLNNSAKKPDFERNESLVKSFLPGWRVGGANIKMGACGGTGEYSKKLMQRLMRKATTTAFANAADQMGNVAAQCGKLCKLDAADMADIMDMVVPMAMGTSKGSNIFFLQILKGF